MTGAATDTPGVAVETFLLPYEGFEPETESLREVLTSTGNGRWCVRGAIEWEHVDGVRYPGTYDHGCMTGRRTSLVACRCSTRIWSPAEPARAQAED